MTTIGIENYYLYKIISIHTDTLYFKSKYDLILSNSIKYIYECRGV